MPRTLSFLDRVLDFLTATSLAAVLVFAPLAFGAVHRWARTTMSGILLLTALVACARWVRAAGSASGLSNPARVSRLALIVGILLVGWLLFQIVPLPPPLLCVLSPSTYRVLSETLPGWPAGPGYAAALLPGTAAWTPLWRPLALSPYLARDALLQLLTYALAFLIVARYPWRDPARAMRRIGALLVGIACFEGACVLHQAMTGSDMIFWFRKPVDAGFPSGTYVNRNHVAGLLAATLPIAGAFALQSGSRFFLTHRQQRQDLSIGQRIQAVADLLGAAAAVRLTAQIGLVLFLFIALYRTLSRAGILAPMGSALLLAPLLNRPARPSVSKRWLTPSMAVLGFLLLLGSLNLPELSQRFSQAQLAGGAWGRQFSVREALPILRDFPLFGVGLGGFQYIFPAYRSYGGWHLRHVHNDYLELAIEAGLPALFLAVVLLAILYARAVSAVRKHRETRYILWGFLVGTTALMFHSLVDFNLHIPANALVFAVLLGGVARFSHHESQPIWTGREGRLASLGLAAALSLVVYVHLPVARADLEFRRVVPDTTIRSAATPPESIKPPAVRTLARLAATAPQNPFIQSELGRALIRDLRRPDHPGDVSAPTAQALHHFAAAARGIPQWARPHLWIGIIATAGWPRADAAAALTRAQRLDPRNRTVSRSAARARLALLRRNGDSP